MLYTKLADRATVGFQNEDAIKLRALEYIYEAENKFARKTGNYQVYYDDLMVRADNSHLIDLPNEFKGVAGRVEWNNHALIQMPDFRKTALMKSDFSWVTGEPCYYFIVNQQLYLYPEPTVNTYRLGILLDTVPPESRDATTEVSTVTVQGTISGGEYFYLYSASTSWCIWLQYDGSGVDPEIDDYTSVQVTLNSTMTDAEIATALATAIDALTGVGATASGSVVTITQSASGAVTNLEDINTGYLFHVSTIGRGAQTSPGVALPYHDILPLYAKAQLYYDRGDTRRGDGFMAQWIGELNRAKFEIDIEGQPNPGRIEDVTGGAPRGRLAGAVGFPGSNTVHRASTTVSIRRGTQSFSNAEEVVVAHNWGTYPIVQAIDTDTGEFVPTVTFNSANQFTVTWTGARNGEIQYS